MQICEACKKFYQRAINKTEGKQYVGGKVQNCNQFKKTLEEQLDEYKCKKYSDSPSKQYFRLKKCIEIRIARAPLLLEKNSKSPKPTY